MRGTTAECKLGLLKSSSSLNKGDKLCLVTWSNVRSRTA